MADGGRRVRVVKPLTRGKRLALAVLLGLLAAGVADFLHHTGAIADIELASMNWRVRETAEPVPPDTPILIVAIDQDSLDHLARLGGENAIAWPWPRDVYIRLLSFCERGGAKVIVFDHLLTETGENTLQWDAELAAAISDCDVPVVLATEFVAAGRSYTEAEPVFRERYALPSDALAGGETAQPLEIALMGAATFPFRQLLEGVRISDDPSEIADARFRRLFHEIDPIAYRLDSTLRLQPRMAETARDDGPTFAGGVNLSPGVDGTMRRYSLIAGIDGSGRDRELRDSEVRNAVGVARSSASDAELPPRVTQAAPIGNAESKVEHFPSLTLATLMAIEGVDHVDRDASGNLVVGRVVIPVDAGGRRLLKYRAPADGPGSIGGHSAFPELSFSVLYQAEAVELAVGEADVARAQEIHALLVGAPEQAWLGPIGGFCEEAVVLYDHLAPFEERYGRMQTEIGEYIGSPLTALLPPSEHAPPYAALLSWLDGLAERCIAVDAIDPAVEAPLALTDALRYAQAFIADARARGRVADGSEGEPGADEAVRLPLPVLVPIARYWRDYERAHSTESEDHAVVRGALSEGEWAALDWETLPALARDAQGRPTAKERYQLQQAIRDLRREVVVAMSRVVSAMCRACQADVQAPVSAFLDGRRELAERVVRWLDGGAQTQPAGDVDGGGDGDAQAVRDLIEQLSEHAAEYRRRVDRLPAAPVDASIVKDRIVILGGTAPGLKDIRKLPTKDLGLGVETHATALDNILRQDFLREATPVESRLVIYGLALLAAALAFFLPGLWLGLAADGLLAVAYTLASVWLFGGESLWLPWAAPLIGIALAYAGSSVASYALVGRDRKRLKGAMAQYMGAELVTIVEKHPERLKLGGDRRELTVYFSDVAGFTGIAEKLEPELLVLLLNRYLSRMTDIVLGSGGIIDKYIGDAVMAVWGAPFDLDDHAAHACTAALRCKQALDVLRPQLVTEGYPPLYARAGVNSGHAVAGNMGSDLRFSYTVMGDTVNLAARLEPWCKEVGAAVLIGPRTRELAGETVVTRMVDKLQAKGKTEAVPVYELVALAGEVSDSQKQMIAHFDEAFLHFLDRDWDEAMELATEALRAEPDDDVSKLFIARCMNYKENPPPDSWDGRTIMRHK